MDAQWLKSQFDLNPEKTKTDLARALGLEPPAVSKILNGARQIKAHEYHSMRRFFGLPTDGERAAQGGPHHEKYVLEPLKTYGQAYGDDYGGLKDSAIDAGEWIIPAHIMAGRTRTPSEQIRVFKVEDTMMEPEFKKNEHVLVDLSDQTPSPAGSFVISDGFGNMIRNCEYVPFSVPPHIRITALSRSFQAQILQTHDFLILGRIIARLQWL